MPEQGQPEKPLIPKNVVGASIVAIPLTALLSGFGWIGAKILEVDERQQHHDAVIRELEQDQDLWVARGLELAEKVVKLEEDVKFIQKEQEYRRSVIEGARDQQADDYR